MAIHTVFHLFCSDLSCKRNKYVIFHPISTKITEYFFIQKVRLLLNCIMVLWSLINIIPAFLTHLHIICDITYYVFFLFFYCLFTYLFRLGFGIRDLLVFSVHLLNAHCFIFKCQLKRLILLSFIFLTLYFTFVLLCIVEKNNKFCNSVFVIRPPGDLLWSLKLRLPYKFAPDSQ